MRVVRRRYGIPDQVRCCAEIRAHIQHDEVGPDLAQPDIQGLPGRIIFELAENLESISGGGFQKLCRKRSVWAN